MTDDKPWHRMRMTVVPEPTDPRVGVIDYRGEGTVAISGDDPAVLIAMTCGACDADLVRHLTLNRVSGGLVIRCNGCGAYNQTLM